MDDKNNLPVLVRDRRYERSQYHGFDTFEEGIKFLNDYCGGCRFEKRCADNKYLRTCIGENCPCWTKSFVKLELTPLTWEDDKAALEGLPETVIACKRFVQKKVKKELAPATR